MDEYEAVRVTEEDHSTRRKNGPGDYAHHKSHMNWPGIEPGPPHRESKQLFDCKKRFFQRNRRRKKKKRWRNRKNKKNKYARVTPR